VLVRIRLLTRPGSAGATNLDATDRYVAPQRAKNLMEDTSSRELAYLLAGAMCSHPLSTIESRFGLWTDQR
jgi:hypothetical protein